MKFEITRAMDDLGRIVLPIEIRRFYSIGAGDRLKITETETDFVLSKTEDTTESARAVDELGRFVIPMTLRKKFGIKPKDHIAIEPSEDGIHLHKANA